MRLNKKAIIVATCAACTLGLAAGCAPQQSENAGAAAPSGDGGAVPQEQKLTPEQQARVEAARKAAAAKKAAKAAGEGQAAGDAAGSSAQ